MNLVIENDALKKKDWHSISWEKYLLFNRSLLEWCCTSRYYCIMVVADWLILAITCAFTVSEEVQNWQCSHSHFVKKNTFISWFEAYRRRQKSQIVIWSGYMLYLQSFKHKILSLCFLGQCLQYLLSCWAAVEVSTNGKQSLYICMYVLFIFLEPFIW